MSSHLPVDLSAQPKSAADDAVAGARAGFDPELTVVYQSRLVKAPKWFCSFLASNSREKTRMRQELGKIRGAIALLMKRRNGGEWSAQDRLELRHILRATSAVYPYLLVWVLPGSILLWPFLAWHLDARRKIRERKVTNAPH